MILFRLLLRVLRWVLIVAAVILAIVLGLAYGFVTTQSLEQAPLEGTADNTPPRALAEQLRAEIPGYQRPEEFDLSDLSRMGHRLCRARLCPTGEAGPGE